MMDFLNFMFSGFWTFIGMMMLLGFVGQVIVAVCGVIAAMVTRGKGGSS